MKINLMPSEGRNEKLLIHFKGGDREIMIAVDIEVIIELLNSLFRRIHTYKFCGRDIPDVRKSYLSIRVHG